MDKYKTLIVEDDRFTLRLVELIIANHFPEFEITATTSSVVEAKNLIDQHKPDLVIMDIQLEDGNAFELLREIPSIDFKIIFMSAYQSYLEEAVQFAAVDFIKKPFDESDFVMALDKVFETFRDNEYTSRLEVLFSNIDQGSEDLSILLITKDGNKSVNIKDIEYGEAINRGAIFKLISGESLQVQRPLRQFESLLPQNGFSRCHPLYIVNLQQISSLDKSSSQIILKSGNTIPFEERRKENLTEKLQNLKL